MNFTDPLVIGAFLGALVGILYGLKRIINMDKNLEETNKKIEEVLEKLREKEDIIEKDIEDEKRVLELEEKEIEEITGAESTSYLKSVKQKIRDGTIEKKVEAVERELKTERKDA